MATIRSRHGNRFIRYSFPGSTTALGKTRHRVPLFWRFSRAGRASHATEIERIQNRAILEGGEEELADTFTEAFRHADLGMNFKNEKELRDFALKFVRHDAFREALNDPKVRKAFTQAGRSVGKKNRTIEGILKLNPDKVVRAMISPYLDQVMGEAQKPAKAASGEEEGAAGQRIFEEGGAPKGAGGGIGTFNVSGGTFQNGSFVGGVFNAPINQYFNSGISTEHAEKLMQYDKLREQLASSAEQTQKLQEEAAELGEFGEKLAGNLENAYRRNESLAITL
ncbi:MAG: hypothetical protein V1881_03870, partial [Candidatus Micrarchaeota archaeon]